MSHILGSEDLQDQLFYLFTTKFNIKKFYILRRVAFMCCCDS